MLEWDQVGALVQLARDARSGRTFADRFAELGEGLRRAVPGPVFSAMVIAPQAPQSLLRCEMHGRDPATLEAYVRHYRPYDPMGKTIMEARGCAVLLSDYLPQREFGRDPFSGELLEVDQTRHIAGLAFDIGQGRRLAVTIQRRRGEPDFSQAERRLLDLVAPDLAGAAKGALLHEEIDALAQSEAPADARTGALVLDTCGSLVGLDASARELLARRNAAIDALCADARALAGAEVGATCERFLPGEEGSLRCRLSRGAGQPAQVLVLLELVEPPGDGFARLVERVRLSPREQQVVRLALSGWGNHGIAHQLELSPGTVAVYLQRAYRKAKVRNRKELLGLVQRLSR